MDNTKTERRGCRWSLSPYTADEAYGSLVSYVFSTYTLCINTKAMITLA
jgi:hypothetical protein